MCDETNPKPADPLRAWFRKNKDMSDRKLAKLVGCASTTISRARAGTTRAMHDDTLAAIERETGVKGLAWAKYWQQLREWEAACADKKGRGR